MSKVNLKKNTACNFLIAESALPVKFFLNYLEKYNLLCSKKLKNCWEIPVAKRIAKGIVE